MTQPEQEAREMLDRESEKDARIVALGEALRRNALALGNLLKAVDPDKVDGNYTARVIPFEHGQEAMEANNAAHDLLTGEAS
jgi:hypothetical protein